MRALGTATYNFPRTMVIAALVVTVSGLLAASRIVVDEDPIVIFDEAEPIRIADALINREMDGANVLDIVIETPDIEGLFEPAALKKMEALQVYAEALPKVGGSVSVVDYLKKMNRALNEGADEAYRLPDSRDAVAQYFLLYSAMGDPTDFEEEIDYDYRTANIRVNLKSSSYQDFKVVVEALQSYIDQNFSNSDLRANLSGRVNLNYHWIKDLGSSHFRGLVVALISVWLVAGLLFRSMLAGVFALLPVAASILLIYATMVAMDIRLGVGTSMFAAVAIGLGVDFAIHTLQRYRVYYHQHMGDPGQVAIVFYSSTGKALLLNFLAIGCGFGILMVSKVASLNNFGGILLVSVGTSFLASMTLLPALLRLLNPRFITRSPDPLAARLP
jgi:predicted RND superfamily exporter protein